MHQISLILIYTGGFSLSMSMSLLLNGWVHNLVHLKYNINLLILYSTIFVAAPMSLELSKVEKEILSIDLT